MTKNILLKVKHKCELCGNNSFKIIYKKRGVQKKEYFITDDSYGVHAQIVQCLKCKLVFAYPIEEDKKIQKRYMNFIDPEYEEERWARSKNQQILIETCQKLYGKTGKLLDVGCATGGLLEVAKQQGWVVAGIEPSKWASRVAREKHGLNVINGLFNENSFAKSSFDVTMCIDVIEHVVGPSKLLRNLYKVLKPNGILCIVTPNSQSLIAKLLGENWWHIRPDHIYYFSKNDFVQLLQESGFKILKVKKYAWTFSYDYWASRFKNKLPFVYSLLMLAKKVPVINLLSRRPYSINFGDSLEIYCQKV